MGHRHAIYINVLQGMLMYIACLCPNLVSVHFYAIPILHFKFPKFFIYLSNMTQGNVRSNYIIITQPVYYGDDNLQVE